MLDAKVLPVSEIRPPSSVLLTLKTVLLHPHIRILKAPVLAGKRSIVATRTLW